MSDTSDLVSLAQAAHGIAQVGETLARIAASIERNVEDRARELADARILLALEAHNDWMAGARAAAGDIQAELDHTRHQLELVRQDRDGAVAEAQTETEEVRAELARVRADYARAVAALRAGGFADDTFPPVNETVDTPSGEPGSDNPAAQIDFWLDGVMPPWDQQRELILAGSVLILDPLEGLNDPHPLLWPTPVSRTVPLGGLLLALKAVTSADPVQMTEVTARRVRDVLIAHGVPAAAERHRAADTIQKRISEGG